MGNERVYRVGPAVGKGGFGTVYQAEIEGKAGFRKRVALKMLNEDRRDMHEVRQRMRDEARMLGLVRHRAIVQVDGLVRLQGRWTLVIEWVDGVDLDAMLRTTGPVPPGPAMEILEEIASALEAAYEAVGPDGRALQLLHRDIKPGNVRLTPQGAVKVLDFGVARARFEGREAETQNNIFGSLAYMAPERLLSVEHPSGDVWSLGVLLCEMLLGRQLKLRPINPPGCRQAVAQAIQDLAERGVPVPIVELAERMLSWSSDERPTAREVARAARRLSRSLGGEPLPDWAERMVPRAVEPLPSVDDPLQGLVLTEDPTDELTLVPQPPSAPSYPARAASSLPSLQPTAPPANLHDDTLIQSDDLQQRLSTQQLLNAPTSIAPSARLSGEYSVLRDPFALNPSLEALNTHPSSPSALRSSAAPPPSWRRRLKTAASVSLVMLLVTLIVLSTLTLVMLPNMKEPPRSLQEALLLLNRAERPSAASSPAAPPPAETAPAPKPETAPDPEPETAPDPEPDPEPETAPEPADRPPAPDSGLSQETVADVEPEAATVAPTVPKDPVAGCTPSANQSERARRGELRHSELACLARIHQDPSKNAGTRLRAAIPAAEHHIVLCKRSRQCSESGRLLALMVDELGDDSIAYLDAYTTWLSQYGDNTPATLRKTETLAKRALGHPSVQRDPALAERLHKSRTMAAHELWTQDSRAGRADSDSRALTWSAAEDWIRFRSFRGQQADVAKQICLEASEGRGRCSSPL